MKTTRPLLVLGLSTLGLASCTLLINSEALITPCASQSDCDEALGPGYFCGSGACLPAGADDGGIEPSPEPQADAGSADGGAQQPPNDGGAQPNDGGTQPNDGGTQPNDGGTQPNDGGAQPNDGGAQTDAGPNDGGLADAG